MDALITMLTNVILFVCLAIPGVILSKFKLIKGKESNTLSTILLYVGTPFLIIKNLVSIKFTVSIALILLATALIASAYVFFSYYITKPLLSRKINKDTRGAMQFSSIMANSGFLGIPLATAVFPNEPYILTIITCLSVVNIIFITSMGNYCISHNKKDIKISKIILSPFVISFVIGIILNLIGITSFIPQSNKFINDLAGVVGPLSMIVLGLKMGEVKLKDIFINLKLYYVSFLKLVFQPLLITFIFVLANLFIPIDRELIIGFFIIFAMPSATLGISYIDKYEGDVKNGVSFILGTTILSIITLPILYFLVLLMI